MLKCFDNLNLKNLQWLHEKHHFMEGQTQPFINMDKIKNKL